MNMHDAQKNRQWWLGFLDLATESTVVVATRLEQVHLTIADETFNILERVPTIRVVSEPVRGVHHSISRLSYRAVALGARRLNQLVCADILHSRDWSHAPIKLSDEISPRSHHRPLG